MAVITPSACVDAIAAVIATVPNSGQVHKFRRVMRDEVSVKARLWDPVNSRMCGWMISPAAANTAITERNPGHAGIGVKGGGNNFTTFQFTIEGYFTLDDANGSEATWRDLVWAVADEFNAYGALNISGVSHQLPCDVEQFGFVMLAGWGLLHYARIGIGFRGRTRPNP